MIDFIAGCVMGAFITWAVRMVVSAVRRKRADAELWHNAWTPAEHEVDLGDGVILQAYGGGPGASPRLGSFSSSPPPKK